MFVCLGCGRLQFARTGAAVPSWPGSMGLRVCFASSQNRKSGELKRESLLEDLHQRVRDIQQGPDGYIYVLTEEQDGALLVIKPAG